MDFHLSRTQAKISNQKGWGKSHCKQLDFVKLSWEDPTPLGSICNLKKKKKKAAILHGHRNTTEVKHLSTCKHWKAKLAERKKKKKEKEKKSEYCKLRSTPRSCIWHSSYKTRVYVGIEFS